MDLLQTAANCLDQSLPGQICFSFQERAVNKTDLSIVSPTRRKQAKQKKSFGSSIRLYQLTLSLKKKCLIFDWLKRAVFVLSELRGFHLDISKKKKHEQ